MRVIKGGGTAKIDTYLVMVPHGLTVQQACERDATQKHHNMWVAYRRVKGGCELFAKADCEERLRQKTIGQLKANLIIVAPYAVRLAASRDQPPDPAA